MLSSPAGNAAENPWILPRWLANSVPRSSLLGLRPRDVSHSDPRPVLPTDTCFPVHLLSSRNGLTVSHFQGQGDLCTSRARPCSSTRGSGAPTVPFSHIQGDTATAPGTYHGTYPLITHLHLQSLIHCRFSHNLAGIGALVDMGCGSGEDVEGKLWPSVTSSFCWMQPSRKRLLQVEHLSPGALGYPTGLGLNSNCSHSTNCRTPS